MSVKKTIYVVSRLSVGGAEKFMLSLSDSLCNDNHEQLIISLAETNPLEDEINNKIRFIRLPRKKKLDISPIKKLRKLIVTEKADTVFCLNFFSYFIVKLAMIGVKSKSKIIISYHSTIHVTKKDHLLHKLYARFIKKDELVITVSKKQADYTTKKYKIPANNFQTIHNGVDTTHWTLPLADWNKSEIRKKYNIPEDATLIIKAAAFREEKNHIGAIKALAILHKKYNKKAYLLFAGDGVMREKIEQAVIQYGMNEYVKLAGNQKDLRPLYWSSDLFTLCSKSVETFSIAALEAMACGLPIVLTDIGGAGEMVVEGMNGFLSGTEETNIADSWAKCIDSKFSKENINEFVKKNFSLTQMVKKYKSIILDN